MAAPLADLVCEIAFEPDPGSAYLALSYDPSAGGQNRYDDLGSVTDYTIQAGDYLEYDVWWDRAGARIAFDLETADGSWNLRDSGSFDQNGHLAHPNTAIPDALVLGKWYSRRIAIKTPGFGKTVARFMVALGSSADGALHVGRLRDVRITDNAGTVRKNIWRQVHVLPTGLARLYGTDPPTLALAKAYEEPVWTDVTADFLEAHTRRGRKPSLTAKADPGGGSATLDNRARLYDATNTAGPYYGKIVPNRRFRLRVRRYYELVKLHGPSSLWRLAEAAGPASITDEIGAVPGSLPGGAANPTFGALTSLVGETETIADLDGGDYLTFGDVYDFANRAAFSVEAWIKPDVIDATARRVVSKEIVDGGGRQGWRLFVQAAVGIGFDRWRNGAATGVAWAGAVAGTLYHVGVTYDGDNLRLYVDGVLQATAPDVANVIGHAGVLTIGREAGVNGGYFDGKVSEVAVYSRALTLEEIVAHYDKGRFAWYGDRFVGRVRSWQPRYSGKGSEVELSLVGRFASLERAEISGFRAAELGGARITWVLDQLSFPDRGTIDPGNTMIQESSSVAGSLLDNAPALDHVQDVGEAELGLVFEDASGRVSFHDRRRRISTYAVSVATFSDEPVGDELLYIGIEPTQGNEDIRNEIRIRPVGGATDGIAEDLGSQNRYDRQTESREVWVQTLNEATTQAEYLLSKLREPIPHFTRMTLDLKRDWARLLEQALKREISDRITIKGTPPGGGPTVTLQEHIESVADDIVSRDGRWSWQVHYDLTPADVQEYWVLGDAELSLLGQSTLLGY